MTEVELHMRCRLSLGDGDDRAGDLVRALSFIEVSLSLVGEDGEAGILE